MKLICVGDAMLDVVVRYRGTINTNSDTPSEISIQSGGAGANTAAWAARIGLDVTFVGRVGDDFAGQSFLSELRRSSVNFGDIVTSGLNTGTVAVLVDANGERTMFPSIGANSSLTDEDFPNPDHGALFVSGYSLFNKEISETVSQAMLRTRKLGLPIFLDPASTGILKQFELSDIYRLISQSDFLFLNEEESSFLTSQSEVESSLDFLLEYVNCVAIKCGAKGSIGKIRGGKAISISALPAKVVDTTGAGDAFAAGFISNWLNSADLESSLKAGAALAAQCVANIGARPSVIA